MAFSAWSAENRIPSPECPKCEVRGASGRCEPISSLGADGREARQLSDWQGGNVVGGAAKGPMVIGGDNSSNFNVKPCADPELAGRLERRAQDLQGLYK